VRGSIAFGLGCWLLALYMGWCALYSDRGYFRFVTMESRLQHIQKKLYSFRDMQKRLYQQNQLMANQNKDLLEELSWKLLKQTDSESFVVKIKRPSSENS
jgi:hypothetical protein